jgi:hypothetical protein
MKQAQQQAYILSVPSSSLVPYPFNLAGVVRPGT